MDKYERQSLEWVTERLFKEWKNVLSDFINRDLSKKEMARLIADSIADAYEKGRDGKEPHTL